MICKKCKAEIPDASNFCCICGVKLTVSARSTKKRGNGQGTVIKLPNGKYKAIVTLGYYLENGQMHRRIATKTCVKKTDAFAAIPELKKQSIKPDDMTLHELYDAYISGKDYNAISKSQQDKLGYAWNRLKDIEFRHITTLTVDDLQSVVDKETSTYYPARDMKVMLSHLYNIAIRKEIIHTNKSEYIDLPDAPKAKRNCWTLSEVASLWKDYDSNPFTGYILVMCYAGLRFGELAKIELENIHLDENYMIGGIKTDAGTDREIPIHRKIKPIIEQLMKGKKKRLLEMNEDNFYAKYWDVIKRTGARELPPHTCRHFYFTSMTAAGVQGGIIAETGGHANYSTTMKNYVRIPLADKINAVNQIE